MGQRSSTEGRQAHDAEAKAHVGTRAHQAPRVQFERRMAVRVPERFTLRPRPALVHSSSLPEPTRQGLAWDEQVVASLAASIDANAPPAGEGGRGNVRADDAE